MRPERRSFAAERTALGWQRSSLSLAVIAALLLVNAVRHDEPLGIAAAVVVGGGAAWAGAWGTRLYHRRLVAAQPAAARALLGLAAVTVCVAAVAAAELVGGP